MTTRCLPSGVHNPAMPWGDPLGLKGYVSVTWSFVVDEADRRETLSLDFFQDGRLGKIRPAFAVRHPDAQGGTFHALEHHRRRLLDRDGREAGLEPPGSVLDEPGLLDIGMTGPGTQPRRAKS